MMDCASARTVAGSSGAAATPAPGRIVVDAGRWRVWVDGREVHVRHRAFRLLAALLAADGRVLTRDELLVALGYAPGLRTHLVDVHAHLLRRALGRECIRSVYGAGFAIGEGVEAAP